jgi:hypothetical protein
MQALGGPSHLAEEPELLVCVHQRQLPAASMVQLQPHPLLAAIHKACWHRRYALLLSVVRLLLILLLLLLLLQVVQFLQFLPVDAEYEGVWVWQDVVWVC